MKALSIGIVRFVLVDEIPCDGSTLAQMRIASNNNWPSCAVDLSEISRLSCVRQ